MKYRNSLLTAERNIEIIEAGEITKEKYPVLHSLLYDKRSNRREHILNLYGFMMYHEPVTIFGRLYWWELSQSQRAKEGFTGAIATWQSQLMFFHLCGILERIKPNKRTSDTYMREKYFYYAEQRQQPPIFYAPVLLADKRLREAERTAADFLSRGFSPSMVTKKQVIRYRGQRIANGIYQNGYKIPKKDDAAEDFIVRFIEAQIKERGYATPKDTPEKQKYLRDFKRICIDHGFSYHRVTPKEAEAFGLKCSNWIATRNS